MNLKVYNTTEVAATAQEITDRKATVSFNKYLSETKLFEKYFQKGTHLAVQAPTGGGKTWYALSYFLERYKSEGERFVFVAPTKVLAGDTHKGLIKISENFVGISKNDLHVYHGETSNFKTPPKSGIIVTIQKHLHKFKGVDTIVIDEAHTLSSEYNYRSDDIQNVMEVLIETENVVYLSGTPIYSKDALFEDLMHVKAIREESPKVTVQPIRTGKSVLPYVVGALIDTLVKEEEKTVFINLPDTGDYLLEVKTIISELSCVSEEEIVCMNANTLEALESDSLEALDKVSGQYLKQFRVDNTFGKAKVIISTYLAGFNLYGQGHAGKGFSFIFMPNKADYTADKFIQFAQGVARPRHVKDIDAYIIRTEREFEQKIPFKFYREDGNILAKAVEDWTAKFYTPELVPVLLKAIEDVLRNYTMSILNKKNQGRKLSIAWARKELREMIEFNKSAYRHIGTLCIKDNPMIDEQEVSYQALELLERVSRRNPSLYKSILEYRGFTVLATMNLHTKYVLKELGLGSIIQKNDKPTIQWNKKAQLIKEKVKLKKDMNTSSKESAIVEFLKDTTVKSRIEGLTKKEWFRLKENYSKLIDCKSMKGCTHSHIKDYLTVDLLNDRIIERVTLDLRLRYFTGNIGLVKFRRDLFKTFKVGSYHTPEEVQESLTSLYEKHDLRYELPADLSTTNKCKAFLRKFFELDSKTFKVDGKNTRKTAIKSTL